MTLTKVPNVLYTYRLIYPSENCPSEAKASIKNYRFLITLKFLNV